MKCLAKAAERAPWSSPGKGLLVLHAVLVAQGALHNVAEDFCVPVGVGTKSSTGLDEIVIQHTQAAKALPLRIEVVWKQGGTVSLATKGANIAGLRHWFSYCQHQHVQTDVLTSK